jgi:Calcineurin-like phosphoesterase
VRVLVAHLSDIHIKGERDPVLARATRLAEAVNSRNNEADAVVLIVTGDIAFSGKRQQYEVAAAFIADLAATVHGNPAVTLVPGNHDCDFDADLGARTLVINGIRQDPNAIVGASIVAQCVGVQSAFFDFRNSIGGKFLESGAGPLYYEYRIPVRAEHLVVRCYNTAWVSQLRETPGTLTFPLSALPVMSPAHFVISAFHHPYNWLSPSSLRPFRRMVEGNSSIVLTGHEHARDRSISFRPEALTSTSYIEGAALQENAAPSLSAFNLMLIDTEANKQQFHHFSWDGERYRPLVATDEWEALPLHLHKSSREFEIRPAFREWLDDAGFPSANKTGKKRLLSEVFLYPQLIEAVRDTTMRQRRNVIKSADVFPTLRRFPLVFVAAPPKGGRTALAKRLFLGHLSAGDVPVYLEASEGALRPTDGVPSIIFRQVEKQYGAVAVEAYRQLDRGARVILIDNIDRLKLKADATISLLSALQKFAGHIVVLGDDTTGRMTELALAADAGSAAHNAFEVQPFNQGLRERLAQQWFSGSSAPTVDDSDQSRLLSRVGQTLDVIIGKNYVPAFPIYVIAVLQAFEEGETVDVHASTHGYFYEILIRLALSSGGGARSDFDIRLAFLTHLAAEMFETSDRRDLPRDELRASFDRYQQKHNVGRLDYDSLVESLVSRGMFVKEAGYFRFRYPYLYYFFVARHLSRNIGKDEVRRQIEQLAAKLYDEEAGDILLFLVHLSSDRFIIDKMLHAASWFFELTPQATLDSPLMKLLGEPVPLTYVERNSSVSRQEWADSKDAHVELSEQTGDDEPESDESKAQGLGQNYAAALQTLRILGQILKNFPGSLEANTKIALTEACYGIGLRGLAAALQEIEAEKQPVAEQILKELRDANPGLPDEKLRTRVDSYFWFVALVTSYGLIKAVATSVAAPELEPTYAQALRASPTTATKLIDAALRLDVSEAFPIELLMKLASEVKDAPLPLNVLRILVLEHFHQVVVPRRELQSACAKLGIDYQPLRLRPVKET